MVVKTTIGLLLKFQDLVSAQKKPPQWQFYFFDSPESLKEWFTDVFHGSLNNLAEFSVIPIDVFQKHNAHYSENQHVNGNHERIYQKKHKCNADKDRDFRAQVEKVLNNCVHPGDLKTDISIQFSCIMFQVVKEGFVDVFKK